MALKEIVLLIFALAVFGEGRHTHPGMELGDETKVISLQNDQDTAETDSVNLIKPKKLSLLSSILFFKTYEPCEDGFKLDYQGICREVWF